MIVIIDLRIWASPMLSAMGGGGGGYKYPLQVDVFVVRFGGEVCGVDVVCFVVRPH